MCVHSVTTTKAFTTCHKGMPISSDIWGSSKDFWGLLESETFKFLWTLKTGRQDDTDHFHLHFSLRATILLLVSTPFPSSCLSSLSVPLLLPGPQILVSAKGAISSSRLLFSLIKCPNKETARHLPFCRKIQMTD